jgi:hypothetical protein
MVMSRGVERLDPYGDGSERAWVGRDPGSKPPEEPRNARAALERQAGRVARELGVEAERVREALRRVLGR